MCLTDYQKKNMKENVGNMKGLLAESKYKALTRAILRIPVRLLTIDERYQTPIRTERSMSYLVDNWDEHKLLPLTVVPHEEEGVFAIVDGYGRLTASQKVDAEKYKELECLVILDAPTDPKERLRFEADEYAFQNVNVAKLRPLHKHGAMQVKRNKQVLDLDKLKKKYGFEYVADKGKRGAETLGSYVDCLKILKSYGYECMDWVFNIIQKTGFERMTNGYCAAIVRGLKDMYNLYGDKRKEVSQYYCKVLRGMTPSILNASARTMYPILEYRAAVSMYLEDMIVNNLGYEPKRMLKDGKAVPITTTGKKKTTAA